jgi:endonuclease YncB( thermonuclease family)
MSIGLGQEDQMCELRLLLLLSIFTQNAAPGQEIESAEPDSPKVERTIVRSASRFVDDQVRIVGSVTVIDAHTLRYGTEVDLLGMLDAPDLEQTGRIGEKMYPLGREAAEFLRGQIGDRPVTSFIPTDRDDWDTQTKFEKGHAFVSESSLNTELVRNGWATAHHTGMQSWEAIARLNKRGIWQGQFVPPEKWRKGERLPGER